jgi:uncharacterized membrane protein
VRVVAHVDTVPPSADASSEVQQLKLYDVWFNTLGAPPYPLPQLVGMDATGTIVVMQQPTQVLKWTRAGGYTAFGPFLTAKALSGDGHFVVGSSNGYAVREADSGEVTVLSERYSTAYAVSADGSVVVGGFDDTVPCGPFRWTQSGGAVPISPPTGSELLRAVGVSADGSVVIGYSTGNLFFRWTAQAGASVIPIPANCPTHVIGAISADGHTVVGGCNSGNDAWSWRWTEETGIVGIGLGMTAAYCSSADASMIGGVYQRWGIWYGAFYRSDGSNGGIGISGEGIDTGDWSFRDILLMSADGKTVAGLAWNYSTGQPSNYVVRLP